MKNLYRIIIVVGCSVSGLLLGMGFATVTDSAADSGLAGGAIVLGYGVMGALIAAALGLVVALRLTQVMLARVAVVMGIILIAFVVYASLRIRAERLSLLDPPAAYEGIPLYVVRLERTHFADPVLARRVQVDSRNRTWTMDLPDGRTCTAAATAASLGQVADAFDVFLKTTGSFSCEGEPDQVVHWQTDSGVEPARGQIELTEACLVAKPEAQSLVFSLQQVSLASKTPVECK